MDNIRTQIILTPEEHKVLRYLSKEKDVSIASLIRKAVEKTYLETTDYQRRMKALKEFVAFNDGVSDWSTMKKEITKGMLGKRGRVNGVVSRY